MAEDDGRERTEEPTEKRRREFREKGQVAQSREVNTAMLLSGTLLLWSFYAPFFWQDLKTFLGFFWRISGEYTVDSLSLRLMALFILKHLGLLLAVMLLGFLSGFLQIGWLLTGKPLKPDFTKLDPIKGLGRMVSKRSLFEALKSLGKIAIVGLIAYWTLFSAFDRFLGLAGAELSAAVGFMSAMMGRILLKCCLLLVVIALIDYLFTRWEMEEKMKMTKQEVKEEHKETEGDPMIKQKVRSIQRQMATKRMMAEVPKADVIITNPTHYAVALRYDRDKMDAPVVTAKGAEHLAKRIREMGVEHKVPIVENPVVARALYQVELGQVIPEHMFKAVAEILAYVYSLRKPA